jgi:hypothetical protein
MSMQGRPPATAYHCRRRDDEKSSEDALCPGLAKLHDAILESIVLPLRQQSGKDCITRPKMTYDGRPLSRPPPAAIAMAGRCPGDNALGHQSFEESYSY